MPQSNDAHAADIRARSTPRVYIPRSQSELLQLLRRHPDSSIYAGGTALSGLAETNRLNIPSTLVALYGVEDLRRIARTDRYIEIGANATIRAVSRVGSNVIPRTLYDCLPHIVPPGLRTIATLVGNVCVPGTTTTSVAPLIALGSSIEIRRVGGSRWMTVQRFRSGDSIHLQPGEVVTRLRIPLAVWDAQVYRASEDGRISFAAIARRSKGGVDAVRIVIGTRLPEVIHNRELDAELTGRKLPLPERDIRAAAERLRSTAREHDPGFSNFDLYRIERLVSWFLRSLTRRDP